MVAKVSDSAGWKEKTSKTVSSWRLGISSGILQHRNVTKSKGTFVQRVVSSNLRNVLFEVSSHPRRKNVTPMANNTTYTTNVKRQQLERIGVDRSHRTMHILNLECNNIKIKTLTKVWWHWILLKVKILIHWIEYILKVKIMHSGSTLKKRRGCSLLVDRNKTRNCSPLSCKYFISVLNTVSWFCNLTYPLIYPDEWRAIPMKPLVNDAEYPLTSSLSIMII